MVIREACWLLVLQSVVAEAYATWQYPVNNISEPNAQLPMPGINGLAFYKVYMY